MQALTRAMVVALLGTASTAAAQDAASADAFVRSLYAAYHSARPDYLGRQAGAVFARPLLRLIRRDAAQTPAGDAPNLDGDPICDCQDSAGLKLTDVKVEGGDGHHATATVRFRIAADRRTVTLDLAAVQGHWRVSDVHTAEMPSLVSFLTRSLRISHPKD
ncbi:DUF3828 domain-containing protein [Phenylobacterium sp.]|jgi:hypothetical protein|uniref:DUF3828 domain-containing protein n=1 Tax=Phenylobacterium sp. TaxID=1871053 RepID=UPI002E318580|nr:DUF3828 domain-containing protein [Phenylobacterium sp.]HEX3364068.1 DUF3828 domain-containing protein [Phenylobacterium sp.]